MQTDVQPNYVVEARIARQRRPDEWVVLGNHHDAWVFGGVDPSSGTATMMEMTQGARASCKREGMRPRRTLVFCAGTARRSRSPAPRNGASSSPPS